MTSIHQLLRSTITHGEDDPIQRSPLAQYIGQGMNSPVSSGQLTKLGWTYTQQTEDGPIVHPSADDLWANDPLFRQFVAERVQHYRNIAASPAVRRTRLVNIIINYHTPGYGWFAWRKEHSPSEEGYSTPFSTDRS